MNDKQAALSELQLKALNYAYYNNGAIVTGHRCPVHKSVAISLVRAGLLTFKAYTRGEAGSTERYVLTLRGSQLVLIGKMLWRVRV